MPQFTPNLMIVDDDQEILNALSRLFRKEKLLIYQARNAKDGLGILDKHRIDLIISDYQMPEMNGIEFLKIVKENRPSVIRILLTGHADLKVAVDAINKGQVYRFLTKPWDNDELRAIIRQALEYYCLKLENQILAKTVTQQKSILHDLEKKYPGINEAKAESDGSITIDQDEISLEDLSAMLKEL